MGPRDKMVPLDSNVKYGQARGYEQAYMEEYETKGKWPGNQCNSIAPDRTDSRANSMNKSKDAKAATF